MFGAEAGELLAHHLSKLDEKLFRVGKPVGKKRYTGIIAALQIDLQCVAQRPVDLEAISVSMVSIAAFTFSDGGEDSSTSIVRRFSGGT